MVSGSCFTGLVLYILFALSYYALIKAILSLASNLYRVVSAIAEGRVPPAARPFFAGGPASLGF